MPGDGSGLTASPTWSCRSGARCIARSPRVLRSLQSPQNRYPEVASRTVHLHRWANLKGMSGQRLCIFTLDAIRIEIEPTRLAGASQMRQYIALIHKEADSDYGVSFPDLPGVITAGSNLDDARK